MHKSKKILLASIVPAGIIAFGVYMAFIRVKPILSAHQVNKDHIEKILAELDYEKPGLEQKTIAQLAASIKQVSPEKQRGLWLILSRYAKRNVSIEYCRREISCQPANSYNKTVSECVHSICNDLFKEQKYSTAKDLYLEYLKIKPHNLDLMYGLVPVFIKLNDNQEALRLIDKIYASKDFHVRYLIGTMHEDGKISGRKTAREKALKAIAKLKLKDQVYCYLELGKLFASKYEYDIALKYFQNALKCAPEVITNAQKSDIFRWMGDMYERQDKDNLAEKYYRSAIANAPGEEANHDMLFNFLKKMNKYSIKERVEWLKKGAATGSSYCQFYLGEIHRIGLLGKKDYVKALEWYRKAAEQGYAAAQFYVGVFLFEGKGTSKNHKQAVIWLSKGAMNGDAACQNNLGYCYEQGIGVANDNKKAYYWFYKAANSGDIDAQQSLAKFYEKGIGGLNKDLSKARKWYKKAAEQGNSAAKKWLKNH